EARVRREAEKSLADAIARAMQAEAALADARTAAVNDPSQAEIEKLRGECAAAQHLLTTRQNEFAATLREAGETNERTRQDGIAALVKAERSWHAGEAERIAEAETAIRNEVAAELAEATSRYTAAEAALTAQRVREGDQVHRGDSELDQLRDENVLMKAELGAARALIAKHGLASPAAGVVIQKPKHNINAEMRNARFGSALRLGRDLAIAGTLAVLAFAMFPRIEPLLPYEW